MKWIKVSYWALVFLGITLSNLTVAIRAQADCTTAPSGIVAWWPAEGNANDVVGTNNGTFTGGTYTNGIVNGAFQFNGTNGSVMVPDSPSLDSFTNSISIEFWMKAGQTNANSDWKGLVTKGNSSWRVQATSLDRTVYAAFTGLTPAGIYGTRIVNDGQWHHIAAVYDGSRMYLYVDGTLDVSQSATGLISQTTDPLCIGANSKAYVLACSCVQLGYFFNGSIDEVSIYKHALSSNEVAAIYVAGSAGKCSPTPTCVSAPNNIVAWWPAEGNAYDIIGTNNGIQSSGLTFTTGEVNQAFLMNSTNAYFHVPASPSLNVGAGSGFTIETWIKPSNVNGLHPIAEWNNETSQVLGAILSIGSTPSSQGVLATAFTDTNGANFLVVTSPSGTLVPSVWQHVALTYDRATHMIILYVNGAVVAQSAWTGDVPQTSYNFWVGHRPEDCGGGCWTDGTTLTGPMDEICLYNRALTSNEIASIYQAGSSGKCSPTPTCVSAPTNIVAWWPAEGNAVDIIGNNNGSLSNGVGFGTGEVGQAFNFNNSGTQAVNIPWSPSLNITNQVTIEFWMKPNATNSMNSFQGLVTSDNYLISIDVGNPNLGVFGIDFAINDNGTFYQTANANGHGATVTSGVWHHVAGTYDGTKLQLYIDGKPYGNPMYHTGKITAMPTNGFVSIGSEDGRVTCGCTDRHFWGSIDEPAIYNRALSSNEIAAIYLTGSDGKCPPYTTTQSCVPVSTNIVAWWPAEGNAVDIVGNNNGTITNGVGFGTGEAGQAFSFNGSTYIQVPDSPSLRFTNTMTVETWINLRTFSGANSREIVSKFAAGYLNQNSYTFSIDPATQKAYFDINAYDYSKWTVVYSSVTIPTNQWVHLAGVVDGTSVKIYVNGQLSGSVPWTNGIFPGTAPLTIGCTMQASPTSFFNGLIDELSLYKSALSSAEIASIYLAGSAGKCTPSQPIVIAPSITSQPQGKTVTAGTNVSFNVTATGTAPLAYQWYWNGSTAINGATNASLTLTNVQVSQAGNYSVTVSNAAGSVTSSNATLTVNYPTAIVKVVSTNIPSGRTVSVPIVLVANGNENGLGFSLNFDPQRLTFNNVSLGSGAAGATLMFNGSQASSGVIGCLIGLDSSATFAPGSDTVLIVNFTSSVLSGTTQSVATAINFVSQPTATQLTDASANALPATFVNGSVTLATVDLEGDVAPRPTGSLNHVITVADWVQEGRFVAGLDTPAAGGEFQRADVAPRVNLGNGTLNVADWVQVGRYAVGLDPLAAAGGPTNIASANAVKSAVFQSKAALRVLQITNVTAIKCVNTALSVNLQSQGDESAISFSFAFNPAAFMLSGVTLGNAASGAALYVNTNSIATGNIGITLGMPIGTTFAAGLDEITKINLLPVATCTNGTYSAAFADQPVPRVMSDAYANEIGATYTTGTVTLNGLPELTITPAGTNIVVSWPAWAQSFALQACDITSFGNWTNVTSGLQTNTDAISITVPAADHQFYRLQHNN